MARAADRFSLLLFGLTVSFLMQARAQSPYWTVYTTSNSGLSDNWVYAVEIDQNNVKWVGTRTGGLIRYDGTTWVNYTTANSGLPNIWVRCLAADKNGNLWVGTHGGGLARFDGSTWTVYNTSNSGLRSNYINALAIDPQGIVWVGTGTFFVYTETGGLAKFNGTTWTAWDASNSAIPGNFVTSVAIDKNGDVWVGTIGPTELLSFGVGRFNGSTWTTYDKSNSGLPADAIYSIMVDPDGTKWIGTGRDLTKFDGASWKTYTFSSSGLPNGTVDALAIDASGAKWIGTGGGGLAKFDGVNWTVWNTSNSPLPASYVQSIKMDTGGNVWIGTSLDGGLAVYGLIPIVPPALKTPKHGAENASVNPLLTWNVSYGAKSYRLQVSTDPGFAQTVLDRSDITGTSWQVYSLSEGTTYYWRVNATNAGGITSSWSDVYSFTTYSAGSGPWALYTTKNSPLPGFWAYAVTWDKNDNVWVGTSGGASKFDGNEWMTYTAANSPLPYSVVHSIAVDHDGVVWFATAQGLARLIDRTWTVYRPFNSPLPMDWLESVVVDSRNVKWIATPSGGIARFDGSTWIVYRKSNSGLPSDNINDLAVDRFDNVWIAADYVGIAKFDGSTWTVYTASNSGVPIDRPLSIEVDRQGNVWVGTLYDGLAKFNGTTWAVYTPQNSGLASTSVRTIAVDSSGTMWFGTNEGLSKFDGAGWTTYSKTNSAMTSDIINDIHVHSNGNKWIATADGLAIFNDGKDIAPWKPALVLPVAGSQGEQTTITFRWNSAPRAATYDLSISQSPLFVGLVYASIHANTFATKSLSNYTTYYWRVRSVNSGGSSIWSETRSFTTVVAAPTPAFPADQAVGLSPEVTFEWHKVLGAVSYRLQVFLSDQPSQPLIDQSGISDTVFTAQSLEYARAYLWRLLAVGSAGAGDWSQVQNFMTLAPLPPPEHVSPPNDARAVPTSIQLKWASRAGAASYSVQVSTSVAFSTLVVDQTARTDTAFTIQLLGDSTTYYWRVSTTNAAGRGAWSMPWAFKTQYPGWFVYNALSVRLSDERITCITQEQSGSIWIGTMAGGVAHYDGVLWSLRETSNSGLPTNAVRAIAVDPLGRKWFATWGGGLVRYDDFTWGVFDNSNSYLPNNNLTAVAIEGNQIKWIGTGSGLVRFNDITWQTYRSSDSELPSNTIHAIAVDADGRKWVGTDAGLAVIDGLSWTVYSTSNSSLPSNAVNAIAIDGGGVTWIGTDKGLARFDGSWTVFTRFNSGLPDERINAVTVDKAGRPWIGTSNGGLVFFDGSSWTVYHVENSGIPSNTVAAIMIDSHGRKWIGTQAGVGVFNPPLPPPSIPNLYVPADDAFYLPMTVTMSWIPSPNATRYRLQVSTEPAFMTIVFDDSTVTAATQDVGLLAPGTKYYWRVQAANLDGRSDWSVTRSFTTGGPIFVLQYDNGQPTDGFYSPLPNPGQIIANRLTAPTKEVQIISLRYYIQGDHANKGGTFRPVVYASSVALSGVPAQSPMYLGTTVTPNTAGWIDIDVASADLTLTATTSVEFFVGLMYDGTAETKIGYVPISNGRAWKYDADRGEWMRFDAESPTVPATFLIRATVTTGPTTGVVEADVPKEFQLFQNYPNPFNPSTVICYQLPVTSYVSLKVHDLLGREVTVLVEGEMKAGNHEVRWDARAIASGMYIYRLGAGGFVSTKKMIIAR